VRSDYERRSYHIPILPTHFRASPSRFSQDPQIFPCVSHCSFVPAYCPHLNVYPIDLDSTSEFCDHTSSNGSHRRKRKGGTDLYMLLSLYRPPSTTYQDCPVSHPRQLVTSARGLRLMEASHWHGPIRLPVLNSGRALVWRIFELVHFRHRLKDVVGMHCSSRSGTRTSQDCEKGSPTNVDQRSNTPACLINFRYSAGFASPISKRHLLLPHCLPKILAFQNIVTTS